MHPTLMDGVEEMRAYRNVETLTFDALAAYPVSYTHLTLPTTPYV